MDAVRVAARVRDISSFIVMDVLERAQELESEGASVIHLEVGEPDFDAPSCVRQAVGEALNKGQTHYTHSMGIPELREAVCAHYREKYGVSVNPDQVIITSGTSPAMLLVFAVLLEKGDGVIMSDPHYACYPNFVRFLEARPVFAPVFEDDGFQLRPDDIRDAVDERTRAIIVNSPSNPTGNVLASERMQAIAGLSPVIVSDEIYHGLVYEGREHSMLEYTDNVFVLNGFSKLYAMTGLRLGYVIAPRPFIRSMQKMQQNFFISVNTTVQTAGIVALTETADDVARMKSIYNERRVYMISRLKEMGFRIPREPTGAFYVFVNARHLSADSYRLAFDILERAHVGVTPGIDFGKNGEGYLRFCYANSMENIIEGLNRLERYLRDASPLSSRLDPQGRPPAEEAVSSTGRQ